VTERRQPTVRHERREAPETPAGDVLEEDALDRILGAEDEDLRQRRLDECHRAIVA
jgi:hypothetical protein